MFASHLDQQHHALVPSGAHGGGMGGLPGLSADVTTTPNVPAPLGTGKEWITRALIIGGVALTVFLILRAMTKK